ncbi:MAG TPA: pentapeptide repeat-containing protein [Abditibacterium sp.]|jgi:uncharacterized protein YjbI with pentapeptide repeats
MTKIALAAPRLRAATLTPQRLDDIELEAEIDLRGLQLGGLARGEARNGRFSGLIFESARLGAVSWRRAHFEDVVWRQCDLAGLDGREIFASRIEMEGCRATGLVAPESNWRDAVFRDTKISLSQFRFAKFERVLFQNCDLREADFQNADLRGAQFRDCDLRGAQFSFALLSGADFRTCQTENVTIEAQALRGLIVSPLQAAQFAAILGLQVRWNDSDEV